MVFCISAILVVTSISFRTLFIRVLSSSWWGWPEVCWFCLSQELALGFYWFFLFFSVYLIYFLSDLHDFLSSDYALSILPFLILLGSSLGCLLEIFLVFEEGLVLLWTSLLGLVLLHPIDFVWLSFHCHLSRDVFKFALWFHHWPIGSFIACCLDQLYFWRDCKWSWYFCQFLNWVVCSLRDLQEFFLNRGALSEIRKQSVSKSVAFILTVLIVFFLNRIS